MRGRRKHFHSITTGTSPTTNRSVETLETAAAGRGQLNQLPCRRDAERENPRPRDLDVASPVLHDDGDKTTFAQIKASIMLQGKVAIVEVERGLYDASPCDPIDGRCACK